MLFRLGKLLDGISCNNLSEATLEKTKSAVLNFFGGSLPGVDAQLTVSEKALWEKMNCSGNCVIMGCKGRTAPLAAAAVNAAMGEIFLMEDIHLPTSSHPGMIVIPVAMAVGQSVNASGKQIIEAIVAGYEAMGRIGSVLITPEFAKNGLRPASVLAPFGGAVAAVKVMGLGAEEIARALSIAGNTSAGVMEFVNAGTSDICMQNCFAAKSAVMAAELAVSGIQASPAILDGRFGLGLALNNKELDWSRMLSDQKKSYIIDETDVKAFPGCGYVQGTAQSAAALVKKRKLKAEDIEKVTVGVCYASKVWPGVDNQGPYNGTISAMMSHQFMVSSAIIHGKIDVETIKMYNHPEVLKLAERIFVQVDKEIEKAAQQKQGTKLTIELKTGEILEHFEESVVPLDFDGIIQRIKVNARNYFTDARVEEIIEKTLNLENLQSINCLMNLLESDR